MSDYDAVNFKQFWQWQYQRRNATYRKDYDAFIKILSNNNILLNDTIYLTEHTIHDLYLERLNFLEKHKRDPEDYNDGLSSEIILKEVASGKFVHPKYEPKGIFLTTKIVESDSAKLSLQIDLREDVELICKEVRYLCQEYNLKRILNEASRPKQTVYQNGLKSDLNFGVGGHVISPETPLPRPGPTASKSDIRKIIKEKRLKEGLSDIGEQNDLVKSSKMELLKAQMKVKKVKEGKKHDLPRAVGLWLWDQKNTPNQSGKPDMEIIEKFHTKFDRLLLKEDDEKFNQAYLYNNAHLYRILRCTNECIEKVDILSMR